VSALLRVVKMTEIGLTVANQPQHHVWDSEAIWLVEFLERGATINAEQYGQTLKKLTK
jgi:hypothetical protein